MNEGYISGFFDADGSIGMYKLRKTDKFKALKIDFTNTKLEILLEIKDFLFNKYHIRLSVSTKPAKTPNHSISYTLSTSASQKVIQMCKIISSHHPIKKHKINTILKYHDLVTNRNGRYNEREIARKLAYERLFSSSIFIEDRTISSSSNSEELGANSGN